MCRIFGFRSITSSQVHKSLISADNSLILQSERHPDGWGVAYYVAGTPHIIKSSASAFADKLFKKVSGIVSSQTVLAHLRKATQGDLSTTNTHPFQYGKWAFAHNGHIKDLSSVKEQILKEISPHLHSFILGETDSELLFYYLLSSISKKYPLHEEITDLNSLQEIIRKSISSLTKITGPFSENDQHALDNNNPNATINTNYFTFILTNSDIMIAHQGGKNLYYSTHKEKCSESATCQYYNPKCETPVAPNTKGESIPVSHLLFSSEPLKGENIWKKMDPGQTIAIDGAMNLYL